MFREPLMRLAAIGAVGALLLSGCGGQTPEPVDEPTAVTTSAQNPGTTAGSSDDEVAAVPGQDAGAYQVTGDDAAWLHEGYASGVGGTVDLEDFPLGFDPDLTVVVSTVLGETDAQIVGYDTATGAELWSTEFVACEPDSSRSGQILCQVETPGGYDLAILDALTGELTTVRELPGNFIDVHAYRDGMALVRIDSGDDLAAYWLVQDGEVVWETDNERQSCVLLEEAVACYNDPDFSYEDLAFWSIADGTQLATEAGPFRDLIWASDGFVVEVDGSYEMRDTSNEVVGTLDGVPYQVGDDIWEPTLTVYYRLVDIETELVARQSTSATIDAQGNVVTANLPSGGQGFLATGVSLDVIGVQGLTPDGAALLAEVGDGSGGTNVVLVDPAGDQVHNFGRPAWLDKFAGIILTSEDGNQTYTVHLPAGLD